MSSDPAMHTRKLQKVGGATYTVSIPKRWAREQGLEAGKDVHLYAHDDGSLVVRSSERDGGALASVRIDVGSATDAENASDDASDDDASDDDASDDDASDEEGETTASVERALRAAYAAGFEEIELFAASGFSTEQSRAVNSLAKTLVGTEVVEESDRRIAVRNLLDPGDVSVQQSLIQIQFVTLSMHREATAAVTSAATAGHVPDRDDEVDRLYAMLTRHFNRSLVDFSEGDRLGVGRTALFEYYCTARQLERVADHAVAIAEVAERLDEPVGEAVADELDEVAADARAVVEAATDAVIDGSAFPDANATLDRRDEVVARCEAIDRTLFEYDSPDAYHLTRALNGVVRTAECGGNVAEVAVQSDLRRQ